MVQQTQYPWDGQVTMAVERAPERELALRLRIPGWAQDATIQVNDQAAGVEIEPLSYVELRRHWTAGDTIRIELPMEVIVVEAHPLVEETRNSGAIGGPSSRSRMKSTYVWSILAMSVQAFACSRLQLTIRVVR